MRLWHKDLIPVLPRQQLLGQWRECCAIAKNINEKGTPNHLLVNKIMDYPIEHFFVYGVMVARELERRGYKVCAEKFINTFPNYKYLFWQTVRISNMFCGWHNDRYFWQCFYNLQEKYDCGGITDEEWGVILDGITWMEMHYQQGKSENPLKDIHPKEIPTQRTEYKYKRKK